MKAKWCFQCRRCQEVKAVAFGSKHYRLCEDCFKVVHDAEFTCPNCSLTDYWALSGNYRFGWRCSSCGFRLPIHVLPDGEVEVVSWQRLRLMVKYKLTDSLARASTAPTKESSK